MKSYFTHFYEFHQGDWQTFEQLAKTVSVDVHTGKKTVDFNPKKFRRDGDFIISIDEDRLHLCFSEEEVIRIPEGVRAIATSAFHELLCPNAKHIILSSTVAGIAQCAIEGHIVEELTINNKYIYISDWAFEHCPTLRMIHHIPAQVTIRVQEEMGRCARPVGYDAMELSELGDDDDIDYDPSDLPF